MFRLSAISIVSIPQSETTDPAAARVGSSRAPADFGIERAPSGPSPDGGSRVRTPVPGDPAVDNAVAAPQTLDIPLHGLTAEGRAVDLEVQSTHPAVRSRVMGAVTGALSTVGNGAVSSARALAGGMRAAPADVWKRMPRADHVVPFIANAGFQVVSCVVPTVARELINSAVFGQLVDDPKIAMGYLAAIYLLKFPAHGNLHRRMNRNLPAAARGYWGKTLEQWNLLTRAERRDLIRETKYRLRLVTLMDVTASIVGLCAAGIAMRTGHTQLPSILVANELRNLGYGLTREFVSGSIKALRTEDARPLTPRQVGTLAGAYGAMQFSFAYAQAYFLSEILPSNLSINGAVLNVDTGEQTLARNRLLSRSQAWTALSKAAVVRGGLNWLVESKDSDGDTQLQIRDTGGKWVPMRWKLIHDRSRMADHSVVRQSWNNFAMMATPFTHFIADQQLAALANHSLRSFLYACSYQTVNSIYKAFSSVRGAKPDEDELEADAATASIAASMTAPTTARAFNHGPMTDTLRRPYRFAPAIAAGPSETAPRLATPTFDPFDLSSMPDYASLSRDL